jgi:hypothetical protein
VYEALSLKGVSERTVGADREMLLKVFSKAADAWAQVLVHTSACVSIRQHTSAYVSISQHTRTALESVSRALYAKIISRMLTRP